MKYSKVILAVLLMSMVSSVELFAALSQKPPVGVPLDGGLLSILGAAGIAYYIARKKKRSSETSQD